MHHKVLLLVALSSMNSTQWSYDRFLLRQPVLHSSKSGVEGLQERAWQFSADFLQHYQAGSKIEEPMISLPLSTQKPDLNDWLIIQTPEHLPPPSSSSWITYEKAHTLINITTMGYVLMKIYQRYNQLYAANQSADNSYAITKLFKNGLSYICPQFIQSLGTQGIFFVDSIQIIGTAFLYKTIAQCVIFCTSGNIFDLLRSIAHKNCRSRQNQSCL
ncbi:MAG: hypothetical protein NTX86_03185 [Candidatus Dependentiae bacterium]|nr:hypothetical protein [Candidatus Dependentiae bacterium]